MKYAEEPIQSGEDDTTFITSQIDIITVPKPAPLRPLSPAGGPPEGPGRVGARLLTTNADRVNSNIIYQFQSKPTGSGSQEPDVINKGRFAKVYRAIQRSDGQNIRTVAIKILHNTARYVDQNLFEQEIALLKELSTASRINVVNILDVVHLGPMIMCGCGRVYHPLCPQCGKHRLQGGLEKNEYPSLVCPDSGCGYAVSAMNIEMQYKKLTSPPAKTCCKDGPGAAEGTIINFVDRPAVVMELQEARLDEVHPKRTAYFTDRCQQYRASIGRGAWRWGYGKHQKIQDEVRLRRAIALDKLMLMVQLAEAVAWLHKEMEIVHKDLTPDNVMVNFTDSKSGQAHQQSRQPISFQELLNDLVSYPTFGVKVIDFGLSDRRDLSRKWYEEKDIINAGMDKAPYFSPEAKQRMQVLNFRLSIDAELKRFIIPRELKNSITSVHEGDLITFQWDHNHVHDLTIKLIEPGPEPDMYYAYFEGLPPEPKQQEKIQMVLPLGEPHDIYSVGALFYYILTGDHLQVNNLSGFVNVLQTKAHACELTASALLRRHGDSYIVHRDAIPIPDRDWRDRVMELILRAMVRERSQSFNSSRSERGYKPALDLLWATKRIYHGFQQQILSEPRLRSMRLSMASAAALAVVVSVGAGYAAASVRMAPHGDAPKKAMIESRSPALSAPPGPPNLLDSGSPAPVSPPTSSVDSQRTPSPLVTYGVDKAQENVRRPPRPKTPAAAPPQSQKPAAPATPPVARSPAPQGGKSK